MKKALITGITGQDGSYLAEYLISKGYEVHGLKRRASQFNTQRIDHIYSDPRASGAKLKLHYGDMTDGASLTRIISDVRPDEIYNLAAQSHVAVSFESPEYTANVGALGCLRVLEAIRFLGLSDQVKFYQASTSELFGLVQHSPQNEKTPFYPRSPYGVSKLFAHWITVNYREAYGMYCCNGILFNHESPRRGPTFVTKKITNSLARIFCGLDDCLYLGNLDALRDWGHAKDYVEMQWLMLQQENPEDFVIGTGVQTSVRDFVENAAKKLGITIEWRGTGTSEVGIVSGIQSDERTMLRVDDVVVRVDPKYYRPSEVETLLGDASKAHKKLKWTPRYTLDELIKEMIVEDLNEARKEALLVAHQKYIGPERD